MKEERDIFLDRMLQFNFLCEYRLFFFFFEIHFVVKVQWHGSRIVTLYAILPKGSELPVGRSFLSATKFWLTF